MLNFCYSTGFRVDPTKWLVNKKNPHQNNDEDVVHSEYFIATANLAVEKCLIE
jgi:hypothetical protein